MKHSVHTKLQLTVVMYFKTFYCGQKNATPLNHPMLMMFHKVSLFS